MESSRRFEMVLLKVMIDPGHGGSDCGAVVEGFKEADYNVMMANKLHEFASQNLTSLIETRLSRVPEEDPTLGTRAKRAQEFGADLVICLHCNSFNPQSKGALGFYLGNVVSKKVDVINTVLASFPRPLRRSLQAAIQADTNSWGRVVNVLTPYALTQCDAVLFEMGFITNPDDKKALEESQEQIMMALIMGMLRYLSLRAS
jgi:N-acetylmuramoyl-L-alanine amidase